MDDLLLQEADIPPMQQRRVAMFIGRCNPVHLGHIKVIGSMAPVIRTYNENEKNKLETTPVIVIIVGKETSKDKCRNPLSYDDIVSVMKATGQIDNKAIYIKASSAFDAFVKVRERGYEPIMVFGGSDRGDSDDSPYKDMLDKYFTQQNGSPIKHKYISVKRDSVVDLGDTAQETLLNMIEKDGDVNVEQVSGTLARKAVSMGLHRAFAAITGLTKKEKLCSILFKKIQRGLSNE